MYAVIGRFSSIDPALDSIAMAWQWHPDKQSSTAGATIATKRFQRIAEAYALLGGGS